MQVFGLPGHIIRQGRAASRILDAKAPDILVAARHEAVARWRRAMSQGLDAGQAARAVGHSRASLYRWQVRPGTKSRRPHLLRSKTWTKALVLAIEQLREDFPM